MGRQEKYSWTHYKKQQLTVINILNGCYKQKVLKNFSSLKYIILYFITLISN